MSVHEDRIAVVIGKGGIVKRAIEYAFNVRLKIDSKTGDYVILPLDENKATSEEKPQDSENLGKQETNLEDTETKISRPHDTPEFREELSQTQIKIPLSDILTMDHSYRTYVCQKVVEAMNHGFSPRKAFKLLDPQTNLDIIDLEDVVGTSKSKLKRYKGRLIGQNGSIRRAVEEYARVHMSVYRRYLGLIGEYQPLQTAKTAVSMLLKGQSHKVVIAFLQKEYQRFKTEEMTKNWKPVF